MGLLAYPVGVYGFFPNWPREFAKEIAHGMRGDNAATQQTMRQIGDLTKDFSNATAGQFDKANWRCDKRCDGWAIQQGIWQHNE